PVPCITLSGLPQYTEHGNAIILVNINCKKTFSHQQLEQSCDFRALIKACRRSFLSVLGGCRTPDLFLDSADWPCADQMNSPKEKKKPL
ncbi:unnamed protein product, partial [Staurois parvus]